MKRFWISALLPLLLCALDARAELPAPGRSGVAVPGVMVTPVKVVKHAHRTVVRKTTTTRRVVHRRSTASTSSTSTSSSAGNKR